MWLCFASFMLELKNKVVLEQVCQGHFKVFSKERYFIRNIAL